MKQWIKIQSDNPLGLSPSQLKRLEEYQNNSKYTIHKVRMWPIGKDIQIFYITHYSDSDKKWMREFGRRGGCHFTCRYKGDWILHSTHYTDTGHVVFN